MSYIGLGRKKVVAAKDLTGLNTGNWTNAFDQAVLGAKVPYFECHHISAVQVPGVSTLTAYIGLDIWSAVVLAGNAEWDPAQPMLLTPGDEVYFAWNKAASGAPPVVTMWLRYDPAINPATGA
jgi:hypothetical protein